MATVDFSRIGFSGYDEWHTVATNDYVSHMLVGGAEVLLHMRGCRHAGRGGSAICVGWAGNNSQAKHVGGYSGSDYEKVSCQRSK